MITSSGGSSPGRHLRVSAGSVKGRLRSRGLTYGFEQRTPSLMTHALMIFIFGLNAPPVNLADIDIEQLSDEFAVFAVRVQELF